MSTKQTVLMYGCGNIGTRTLQSVCQAATATDRDLTIICVDPSESSLDLARSRVAEMEAAAAGPGSFNVEYATSLDSVPLEIDLAVLSMTANHRRSALEAMFDVTRPETLVLEKFLFPSPQDYRLADELISAGNVKTFVNCPRPVWPGYTNLKASINSRKGRPFEMHVSGGEWAMASNAIHYIAAFLALTEENQVSLSGEGLDGEFVKNKREGYLDVTGVITGQTPARMKLSLRSISGSNAMSFVDVRAGDDRFVISEVGGTMLEASEATGFKLEHRPFEMLFASQMDETFSKLLDGDDCLLPSYSDMVQPHLDLISMFNPIFFGEDHDKPCPVT